MNGQPAVSHGGCPNRDTLAAFNTGRLNEPEMEQLAEHVGTCNICERTLEELLFSPADSFEAGLLRICAEISSKAGPDFEWPLLEQEADTLSEVSAGASTATKQPIVRTPQTLGPYVLIEIIGRGGMGVVYRAVHKILKSTIALKTLHPGWESRGETFIRFRREGETIARLVHPNIVRIYDFNECEGVPYLTMELVEGETLAQRLTRGPLDFRETAELVQKLALAIEYAHTKQVIHRDLKPQNVLLAKDGTPKVTDFGLAKVLDEERERLTHTDVVMGTPSYMSPEQAAGRNEDIGPLTDVYALGTILYESLTGVPAFASGSKMKTLTMVKEGAFAPPSQYRTDIPTALEAICLKCLAVSPADRFPSAEALADELGRWLKGKRVRTKKPGLFRRALRRIGTRRILAATLTLAVGGGLIAAFPPPGEGSVANETLTGRFKPQLKPVDIRGLDGELLPFRIIYGAGYTNVTPKTDGSIHIRAWGLCLIEYTPGPGKVPARFQANVRQVRSMPGQHGYVGLYFTHHDYPGTHGPTHVFCRMAYDDILSPLDVYNASSKFPIPKLPSEKGAVKIESQIRQAKEYSSLFEVRRLKSGPEFHVCGPGGNCERKIAVDLTPEGVSGTWDGKDVPSVPAAEITKAFTEQLQNARENPKGDEKLATVRGWYDAAGGIGLVVDRSTASFNRIEVVPLDKKK